MGQPLLLTGLTPEALKAGSNAVVYMMEIFTLMFLCPVTADFCCCATLELLMRLERVMLDANLWKCEIPEVTKEATQQQLTLGQVQHKHD